MGGASGAGGGQRFQQAVTPLMPGPQPQPQPQGGFNVNQAAAGGLQSAMQGTQTGMNFNPQQVQATGYMPSSMNSQGYNPQGYSSKDAGSQGYDAQGYSSRDAGSQGYDIERAKSQGFNAADVTSQGYSASTVGPAPTVSARDVQAGQLSGRDLGAYVNKYEDQVVQQTLDDLSRNRDMTMDQLSAQATAANAFGGSRQGIAEGEAQRAFAEQAARAS